MSMETASPLPAQAIEYFALMRSSSPQAGTLAEGFAQDEQRPNRSLVSASFTTVSPQVAWAPGSTTFDISIRVRRCAWA
jgi:hypothetical protein